ncbi:MAG: YrrS family protein [Solibacillus sp.]|uniref:YrrS family protein n=1 Tax=Solibacillus sp. FSL H8-0523 TaxID=2954511 RepID=UPI003100D11B
MERKRRFQTRQQYAEEKAADTLFDKLNKHLFKLIGVVAIAIIATLAILISGDPKPTEKAEAPTKSEQPANEDEKAITQDAEDTVKDDEPEANSEAEDTNETTENTVLPSADPLVDEVQVNNAWTAYPTEQTGPHESTYEKGHIDYEEKLKAIFSVLDIPQDNSIVLSVKNNGSTTTAIAVVTSMDKQQKYRVSIEWIDGEGWKPTRLEVLNAVEGAY